MKNITINNQLIELKDELGSLATLHDLHTLEVNNLFNSALIKSYDYKTTDTTVNLNIKNQLVFYNLFSKESNLYNLSKDKFRDIYKNFSKLLLSKSDENIKSIFFRSLESENFIKIKKVSQSKRFLILEASEKSNYMKSIEFKYSINSKLEFEFLAKNDTFWIHLSNSDMGHIKHNINKRAKNIVLNIDVFTYKVTKLLTEFLLKKINQKSNNKIKISVKFIEVDKRIVHLKCNSFIPKHFIIYINHYLLTNTLHACSFIK